MTSPAASGRLQNVIKYYTKVRKTGPNGAKLRLFGAFFLVLPSFDIESALKRRRYC